MCNQLSQSSPVLNFSVPAVAGAVQQPGAEAAAATHSSRHRGAHRDHLAAADQRGSSAPHMQAPWWQPSPRLSGKPVVVMLPPPVILLLGCKHLRQIYN